MSDIKKVKVKEKKKRKEKAYIKLIELTYTKNNCGL